MLDRRCFAILLVVLLLTPAWAGTAPQAYRDAGVVLPADAAAPLDLALTDDSGRLRTLRELIRRPVVLVFADYTCTTLCGPIIDFVASALEQSGLRAGGQFQLLVIGLDPKDGPAEAAEMRRNHLSREAAPDATVFATAGPATVERLTAALGYRYVYDQEHDQFVHPGAAYVLRADGRVARVLTGLGLSGTDMRLALVEAGEGRIGTLGDQVRLLCSSFDPAHGTYDLMVSRLVMATGLASMLAVGGLLGVLMLSSRGAA